MDDAKIVRFLRCWSRMAAARTTTSAGTCRCRRRRSNGASIGSARRAPCAGFTAVVDHAALGDHTEALIELFFAPGTLLDAVAETLRRHPEVVEAWSVTGEADAIARVRTQNNADLERLIMELQRDGLVAADALAGSAVAAGLTR